MKYFRVDNDMNFPDRWILGQVNFEKEGEFWNYTEGKPVEVPSKELSIEVLDEGVSLDFTFAVFDLIVVNEKTAKIFSEEDVQLIPVRVEGVNSSEKYFLMVIKKAIACVDESNSEFEKEPDGSYSFFKKMRINEKIIASDINIFRVKEYPLAVIVSEKKYHQLNTANATGIKLMSEV